MLKDELKFERTVWAERQLAKLCPNNDISKLDEVLATDDFDAQINAIEEIICIMNRAYIKKQKFLDSSFVGKEVTKEELDNLTEEELTELSNLAFESFQADGETEIQTESKNEKAELTESI